eukprot:gene23214-41476_t
MAGYEETMAHHIGLAIVFAMWAVVLTSRKRLLQRCYRDDEPDDERE